MLAFYLHVYVSMKLIKNAIFEVGCLVYKN